jgi:beta-galactosidase/beta-glucuronidase
MRKILFLFFTLIIVINSFAQTTQIRYLSGTDKDHTVQWDFYCTQGWNSGKWTKIAVPSCWELQGFGTYHYGLSEPFDSVRGEKGIYKYNFNVPSAWQGKRILIVFGGVMTDAQVDINGQLAGSVHQGSF